MESGGFHQSNALILIHKVKSAMRKISMFLFSVLFVFQSCSKSSGKDSVSDAPTNLQVTAVVNPDNSGNVLITATATNAVTYEINFGIRNLLVDQIERAQISLHN